MGVPIEASMEVKKIGTALDGLDVVFSVPAFAADGIVVLNRVKPHTDFRGTLGSGIQKMLVIGFGKQVGANNAHCAAAHLGYEVVLRAFAKTILGAAPIFCGIALVEDQHHQTAVIEVIRPENIVREEDRLFQKAQSLLARLPFEEIDLLIIDRIGKDISGSGMDTNVIGRDITGYTSSLRSEGPVTPRVARIFRPRSDPGQQWQRHRDRHGGLHYRPFREVAQSAIHLYECADFARPATGENSHLFRE